MVRPVGLWRYDSNLTLVPERVVWPRLVHTQNLSLTHKDSFGFRTKVRLLSPLLPDSSVVEHKWVRWHDYERGVDFDVKESCDLGLFALS